MLLEPAIDRPRVGLVLGGGGAAGIAFHAGALWALHHDLGWDPRAADVVVGTSAGSIVGALLRSGISAEDLAAWTTDAPPSAHGDPFRSAMAAADLVVSQLRMPTPTVPGWRALGAFARPRQLPGALTSLLPHGLHDHNGSVVHLDRLATAWPEAPLWISAVRVGDGRLEWFGQEVTHDLRLSDAVAASCAIPVLARPVTIRNERFVDGSVRSPTHADALVGLGLDLVIVSSPMGAHTGSRNPLRAAASRRLAAEVAALERAGTAVVVLTPNRETTQAMGWNLLDRSRAASVMRQSFLGAADQLTAEVRATLRAPSTVFGESAIGSRPAI